MLTSLAVALFALASQSFEQALVYRPAPVDNPLKGLVPYAGDRRALFPHSMEFNYLPLDKLMTGRGSFDWKPLDALLNDIASRGHQTVFRVYVEYPTLPSGLPKFLRDEGVKVFEYASEDPKVKVPNFTPDYRDPRLQSTLVEFIEAMGKRYDGDARVGYVTAGLLGYWGEWHTYPRLDLSPSKELQAKVMDAYERAFRRTPVLLRYPAGEDPNYASNVNRRLGYHDDSFAWATLDTGKASDSWFFMPTLRRAGATDKWKRQPIGGEIRPEAWGQVFDPKPALPEVQDFRKCVEETRATWLMDSGMFGAPQSKERVARASEEVRRMGYEFTVTKIILSPKRLRVTVENRGVAPFYHDWPVELGVLDAKGALVKAWKPGWKLTGILPGKPIVWEAQVSGLSGTVLLRVANPMAGGLPVRFANTEQDRDRRGWLTLIQRQSTE